MRILMQKFGTLLNARSNGREAALRLFQIINGVEDKQIILDFKGVEIMTPSFADEFINQIKLRYKSNRDLSFDNLETEVVRDTLKIIGVIKSQK